MIVDTTTWPVHHENELTFDEHMSTLVKEWERYQAMQDGQHEDEDVALAKLELESTFYLTMRQFPIGDGRTYADNEATLEKIMNKVGAEDYEQLEKKVNKMILKNKIMEEAE